MLKNVDKKDIAILRELDLNTRASYSQIGRKVRLSKEVVQYRINKLEEKGIITGYWAIPNVNEGYVYKILIKNRNLGGVKKKEFVDFVTKNSSVSWFSETEGNYDFLMTVFSEDDTQIILLMDEIFSRFGSYFKERHILKTFFSSISNDKYLFEGGKLVYNYKMDLLSAHIEIDDIDREILRLISLNSRIKFTEIAKLVNLTSEAVGIRFKKLVKKGLIVGLKTRINISKLGLSYYHLFIALSDQSKKDEIISYYDAHPHNNSTLKHIGMFDFHIELMLPQEEIHSFMEEFVSEWGSFVEGYELLHIRKEHVMHILK